MKKHLALLLALAVLGAFCTGEATSPTTPLPPGPPQKPTIDTFTAEWVITFDDRGNRIVHEDQTKITWYVTNAQSLTITNVGAGATLFFWSDSKPSTWGNTQVFSTPDHSRTFGLDVSNAAGSASATATIQ